MRCGATTRGEMEGEEATMTKHGMRERAQHMVAGGALALLLAAGAVGAGVQGDPSQWGLTAGDPSQWGLTSRPTTANDPQTALNFTKIELKSASGSGVERAGTRVGTAPGSRDST